MPCGAVVPGIAAGVAILLAHDGLIAREVVLIRLVLVDQAVQSIALMPHAAFQNLQMFFFADCEFDLLLEASALSVLHSRHQKDAIAATVRRPQFTQVELLLGVLGLF